MTARPDGSTVPSTVKGRATRQRILDGAAERIYRHGVSGSHNEALRRETGVSGSQLQHYFADKQALVLAVIEQQSDRVLALQAEDRFDGFATIEGLRAWADHYVANQRLAASGCSLGSLAAELVKSDLDVQDRLSDAFERWHRILRAGIERMRAERRLRSDADAEQLAHLLLAAFQGGALLAQISGSPEPLRSALAAAIDHVESYTSGATAP